MPRAIWKGAISFGLVHVPVALYPASREQEIDFDWLDKRSMDPVGYKRVNKSTGKEVPWGEVVKGYEYKDERYVVMSDEDFRRANPEAAKTVDILAFVELADIAPQHFDTPYYLKPEKRGEKAYALLLRALREKQLTAIATITIRKKEQLCALRARDGALMLETLYYPDEVRAAPETDVSGTRISEREMDMAFALIELLRKPFEPEEYKDHYREALAKLIDAKLEGREVVSAPAEKEPRVIDLADALRRSVEAAKKGKPKAAARSRASRAPARRRTRKVS